jgi:hypothetical protein
MSISLKLVLIFVVLIYIIFIIKSIKKKNMRIEYLILWMFIGIAMIIALIVPNFVENFSRLIGFEMPINMIFSMAIFTIMYILFGLIVLISKEEKKNTMLIQEISILKKRIDELEKNSNKEDEK